MQSEHFDVAAMKSKTVTLIRIPHSIEACMQKQLRGNEISPRLPLGKLFVISEHNRGYVDWYNDRSSGKIPFGTTTFDSLSMMMIAFRYKIYCRSALEHHSWFENLKCNLLEQPIPFNFDSFLVCTTTVNTLQLVVLSMLSNPLLPTRQLSNAYYKNISTIQSRFNMLL